MWAWILAGAAVGGAIMLVMYGIWLWHKASDLFFELRRLGLQAEEMGTLVSQLEFDKLDHAGNAGNNSPASER